MTKKTKKPFNQKLFNLLAVIAIACLVGYAALLTWVVFQFQEANIKTTTQNVSEEISETTTN